MSFNFPGLAVRQQHHNAIMHMVHLLAAISGLVGAFSAFGTLLSQWLEDDLLIPGGSGLKHCDDPGNRHDPETELVTFNRILVEPNPPIVYVLYLHLLMHLLTPFHSGHNLTLTAFGRFEADFSHHASNLSLTYFVNAADAMFSWDTMSFCNATTNVLQTVDGVLRESCPPVEGSAVLISKFYLEKWWPAVSSLRC